MPHQSQTLFREFMEVINKEKKNIDAYVNNLDNKVSSLLERQLYEFLQAQKVTFDKINNEAAKTMKKMEQQEETILSLTDKGEITKLIHHKRQIQQKLSQIESKMVQKNKLETVLRYDIEFLKKENHRLENTVKQLKLRLKHNKIRDKQDSSTIFLTSNVNNNSIITSNDETHKIYELQTELEGAKKTIQRLSNENQSLKRKYRRNLESSIDRTTIKNLYEEFFINCIEKFKLNYKRNPVISSDKINQVVYYNNFNALTANDRFQIFQHFLLNDQLLSQLVKLVFRNGDKQSTRYNKGWTNRTITSDLPLLFTSTKRNKI